MKITVNKKDMMILEGGKLELYVDQKYMGTSMGVLSGSSIETLGLLPYRWYKNIGDSSPTEVGTMDIPSMVEFTPTTIEMDIPVKIYQNSEEKKYTIMTFEAGTEMWSKYGIQSIMNAQIFERAILDGKLDNNIPYTMIIPSWIKNQKLNGVSLGVPAIILGIILHALCIDPKSGKPFGEVLGKDPKHPTIGYSFINIREASAASVFGGLSFEDQNSMLDMAINATLQNKEQKISPLEKILKY